MPIQIIVSNDMWNEKSHNEQVTAYDDLNVYVHFDQAISHELEYIENDVTHFWLEVKLNQENIATLRANRVLPELMNEAKNFRNGKFKFPLCCLPNALSQSYHAAFAKKMSEMPAGNYPIELLFWTDNPLQKDKVLAQTSFKFELNDDAKPHLQKIAEENTAQGADAEEDTEEKKAAFERIKQGSEKFDTVQLTLQNRGASDIWVMIGYNSGRKYLVGYQQSISVSVPAGESIFRYENKECTTNFGYIANTRAEQTFEIY